MIGVCLKWVDRRPEPAGVGGGPDQPDERFAGVSAADQAALEWALRQRDLAGGEIVAVTVGPAAADAVLRDALAAGADRAVRVDRPFGAPSRTVADELATVLAEATTVWCGDYSFDRGTGSVPAFVAAALGIGQALGLVAIDVDVAGIGALRRLDGGRRERLAITGRAVLSVEGGTALLRRAPLRGLLVKPVIDVVVPAQRIDAAHPADARPFRPRPRAFAPPAGSTALDRIRTLTAAGATVAHGETVTLDPPAAAERILSALREWGYI
ncbi:MAG: Electron transfer flavoprotein alpha/beta-subunit [Ilumatobacteraceae bacterium]|nr:Electron transfer flavoprotein alpha/beta-subunit [Ilumatobacteraceae bacterium]